MPKKYGWAHAKKRAAMLPEAYGRPCIYCGRIMLEQMALDYDHSTSRITHSSCNRRAGAKYGNALRGLRRRFSTIYYGR
jgi:hypothetical protein